MLTSSSKKHQNTLTVHQSILARFEPRSRAVASKLNYRSRGSDKKITARKQFTYSRFSILNPRREISLGEQLETEIINLQPDYSGTASIRELVMAIESAYRLAQRSGGDVTDARDYCHRRFIKPIDHGLLSKHVSRDLGNLFYKLFIFSIFVKQ